VLPEAIVSQAFRTHPQFLSPDGARQNDEYIQPARYLRDFAPENHEDDQEGRERPAYERVQLTRTRELAGLRAELLSTLIGAAVADEDALEFVVAVHEVATNGLRHGVPPVSVQLWISRARLTCTVTDCGCGFDDPLVGYITDCGEPSRTNTTGLWLARLTTDHIETFQRNQGFVVRLITNRRDGEPEPPGVEPAEPKGRVEGAWSRADRARTRAEQLRREILDQR
jgi:anti-sigma regulatory factor (Ser/Thr protein kinase)